MKHRTVRFKKHSVMETTKSQPVKVFSCAEKMPQCFQSMLPCPHLGGIHKTRISHNMIYCASCGTARRCIINDDNLDKFEKLVELPPFTKPCSNPSGEHDICLATQKTTRLMYCRYCFACRNITYDTAETMEMLPFPAKCPSRHELPESMQSLSAIREVHSVQDICSLKDNIILTCMFCGAMCMF